MADLLPWQIKPYSTENTINNPNTNPYKNSNIITTDLGNKAVKAKYEYDKKNNKIGLDNKRLPSSGYTKVTAAPHEYIMGGGAVTDIVGDVVGRAAIKAAKPVMRHVYGVMKPLVAKELTNLQELFTKVNIANADYYNHPEVIKGFENLSEQFKVNFNLKPKFKLVVTDDPKYPGFYDGKTIYLNKNFTGDWNDIFKHEYRHAIDKATTNKDYRVPADLNLYHKEIAQYGTKKYANKNYTNHDNINEPDYFTSVGEIIAEIPVVKSIMIEKGLSPAHKFTRESFNTFLDSDPRLGFMKNTFNHIPETKKSLFAENFYKYFGLTGVITSPLLNKD